MINHNGFNSRTNRLVPTPDILDTMAKLRGNLEGFYDKSVCPTVDDVIESLEYCLDVFESIYDPMGLAKEMLPINSSNVMYDTSKEDEEPAAIELDESNTSTSNDDGPEAA